MKAVAGEVGTRPTMSDSKAQSLPPYLGERAQAGCSSGRAAAGFWGDLYPLSPTQLGPLSPRPT